MKQSGSVCRRRAAKSVKLSEATEGGYNHNLGVFQRPLTLILLQQHCDTHGSRIVMQIGSVYATFSKEEGMLLQKDLQ